MKVLIKVLLAVFVFSTTILLRAQTDSDHYYTFYGVVKDAVSNERLIGANIYIPNNKVGTITNENGNFSLKVKKSAEAIKAVVSHIGYSNAEIELNQNGSRTIVTLNPNQVTLNEVVVRAPRSIVEEALKKIPVNYSIKDHILNCFYREKIERGHRFISISEAAMEVYKTPYSQSIDLDFVKILKGRRIVSQKMSDTLGIKLQGGPNIAVYLDVVKNECMLFCPENLYCYSFEMEDFVTIDDRINYVIKFKSEVAFPFALYYGKVYIDREQLFFTRVEFSLDMSSKTKATNVILSKKPLGIKFRPQELSYVIGYTFRDGVNYLTYINNKIRFKCDWKRRLFATNYTVNSEMIVTDLREVTEKVSHKHTFKENQSLSDKIENFSDSEFWENYNIIEPSESLEKAINKLKIEQ